jgi:hypothetical protein
VISPDLVARFNFFRMNQYRMSSVVRGPKNTEQGNAYFINITSVNQWQIRDENGLHYYNSNTGIYPSGVGLGPWAAGELVLRDLGKTIRIPGNGDQTKSANNNQRVLRKVQRLDVNAMTVLPTNFVGLNEGVGGTTGDGAAGFETFYIELNAGPNSTGGGEIGGPARWARLAM